jgi:hypothetical protein
MNENLLDLLLEMKREKEFTLGTSIEMLETFNSQLKQTVQYT